MARHTTIGIIAGLIALAFSTQFGAAETIDFNNPAFVAASGQTSIPVGHAEFCAKHAGECGAQPSIQAAAHLTDGRWQQLLEVNTRFNSAISPVTDRDLYQVEEFWTFPRSAGDCEDFVLAKRRALIQQGWNPSTLLITVVRETNGDGHAVLLVRTDRGDLVLDNQDGLIKLWNETRYQFVKRQSQAHAGQWVDLVDPRSMTLIASL